MLPKLSRVLFAVFILLPCPGRADPLIIAHRGACAEAPENTIPAIRAAVKARADGIEWDTRTTSDGHLILQHDATLKRFVGKDVRVKDLSFDQARRYDVGSRFGKQFAGTGMPTLREAIEAALPGAIPFIERKTGSAEQHLEVVRSLKATDKVVVISFDWQFLLRLRQLEPKLKIGASGSKKPDKEHFETLRRLRPEYVVWEAGGLRKNDVAAFHRLGAKIVVWTVDAPDKIRKFASWGVDRIITNDPAGARKALRQPTRSFRNRTSPNPPDSPRKCKRFRSSSVFRSGSGPTA
jgi:glycerophosphoryl diester phosphodiesterase